MSWGGRLSTIVVRNGYVHVEFPSHGSGDFFRSLSIDPTGRGRHSPAFSRARPYVVQDSGRQRPVFSEGVLIEQGPSRVVVRVRCRFASGFLWEAWVEIFDDSPDIRVDSSFGFLSHPAPIHDGGIRFEAASGVLSVATVLDGVEHHLPASRMPSVVQLGPREGAVLSHGNSVREGSLASGIFSAGLESGVSVSLVCDRWRDTWPAEISADLRSVTLHSLWPQSGRELAEPIDYVSAQYLPTLHRGRSLDLTLTEEMVAALESDPWVSAETTPAQAAGANWVGAERQFSFWICARGGMAHTRGFSSKLVEAFAIPTDVGDWFGRVRRRAQGGFNSAWEGAIEGINGFADLRARGWTGWVNCGMRSHSWITQLGLMEAHRRCFNAHYQDASICWRLGVLAADARTLSTARLVTRWVQQFAFGNAPRGVAGHIGDFWHKTLTPKAMAFENPQWWGHHVDPSCLGLSHLFDGNWRHWDRYRLWIDGARRGSANGRILGPSHSGREANPMVLVGWEAHRLSGEEKIGQETAAKVDALLSRSLVQQDRISTAPFWDQLWFEFARKYRPVKVDAYVRKQFESGEFFDNPVVAFGAVAYRWWIAGDRDRLELSLHRLKWVCGRRHRSSFPKGWSGFGLGPDPLEDGGLAKVLPWILAAAADAGISDLPEDPVWGRYPTGRTAHTPAPSLREGFNLLVRKTRSGPFLARMSHGAPFGGDMGSELHLRIRAWPSLKILFTNPDIWHDGAPRLYGPKGLVKREFPQSVDGFPEGLYLVDSTGANVCFENPFTEDGWDEAALMRSGAKYVWTTGILWVQALAPEVRISFQLESINGPIPTLHPDPGRIRVDDGEGNVMEDIHFLANGIQERTVAISSVSPVRISTDGSAAWGATPSGTLDKSPAVVAAADREMLERILADFFP
jgi:hypothetical protein